MRILGFEMRLGMDPDTGTKTKQVPWVKLSTVGRGNTSVTEYRVDRLKPDLSTVGDWDDEQDGEKRDYMSAKWHFIEKAYEAWLKGMEIPEEGTPLMSWALLTPAEVKLFQHAGIRTVEELASMTANVMGKLNIPNIHQKKEQAKIYLDSIENSQVINRITETEAQNASLQDQLNKAMAQIEALQRIAVASQAGSAPKVDEDGDPIPPGAVFAGKRPVDEDGDPIPDGAIPAAPLDELPDDLGELDQQSQKPAPRRTSRRSK